MVMRSMRSHRFGSSDRRQCPGIFVIHIGVLNDDSRMAERARNQLRMVQRLLPHSKIPYLTLPYLTLDRFDWLSIPD